LNLSRMIKKLLDLLGLGRAGSSDPGAGPPYTPYKESHVNSLYNLLFCDDLDLFENDEAARNSALWAVILAEEPDYTALERIASNPEEESRIRVLAYNRLRASGHAVPSKRLLGVIVEFPMQQGLDTLAAYPDGRVRYLNQSGKVAIFEGGPPEVEALAKELVAVSQRVVNAIGPWEQKRLPPPRSGNVRMTFLVSDGVYLGEGPLQVLERDAMGGPVLAKAAQLVHASVQAVIK
jgi:hypothetical protein